MNSFFSRKTSAALLAFSIISCTALPSSAAARKVERRVQPLYPELAKRMHIEGAVRIAVTIAADGTVTDTRALSGNRMLAPAAEDAIRKWKFAPGDSQSTENIDINFVTND